MLSPCGFQLQFSVNEFGHVFLFEDFFMCVKCLFMSFSHVSSKFLVLCPSVEFFI